RSRARCPCVAAGEPTAQPGTADRRFRPRWVLRRKNPSIARLVADGFRCAPGVVGFDDRAQCAPATSAVAARTAGLGDLLRGFGAVGDHLVDDVAGGPG